MSSPVLEAFRRAVQRETHNLSRWPQLLWQQLYNELQFEGDPLGELLAPALSRRSGQGEAPWVRRTTPLPQSEDLLLVLSGHEGVVNTCAVSTDGRFIVSGSDDQTLKVWESETGRELQTLEGHDSAVMASAFTVDGRFILSAGAGTIKVWDAATGQEVRAFPAGAVDGLAVSPDGRFIVSNDLQIWETGTWRELRELAGHGDYVHACAVSPDGRLIVSAGGNTLKVWETESGRELRSIDEPRTWAITDCAVSPDGSLIVTARGNWKTLEIWDARSGDHLRTLEGHEGPVDACAISSEGRLVVSGSGPKEGPWTGRDPGDTTLRIWDVDTGEELRTLVAGGGADSCAVSPDGRYVVSASKAEATLKVWNLAASAQRERASLHSGVVHGCAVSPDGGFVVSASEDRTLKAWDSRNGQEIQTLGRHAQEVRDCAVSPDASYVVSASDDATVGVWDAHSGEELRRLKGATDDLSEGRMVGWLDAAAYRVKTCAMSPDGRFIVSGAGQALTIWDAATGDVLRTLDDAGVVSSCAVSPDARFMVSGADDGIRVWDLKSGRRLRALTGQANISDCVVSPDGRFLLSSSLDATLKLWDARSGEELRTLLGHEGPVRGCAVSPDGLFFVSGSEDKTIRVWAATSAEQVAMMPLLGAIHSVAVHPWQPIAAVGDAGGALTLMNLLGIEYGPIIVTPVSRDSGLAVRCPACFQEHVVPADPPGQVIPCPTPECDLELRVELPQAPPGSFSAAAGRFFRRRS